jgi:SAM-dependent methyltransferase
MAREYAPGHSAPELDRLAAQAKLLAPFTRRVFELAGITGGMSVLDVGSGVGDVAFLAREIVGPEGRVVGTDRSAEALRVAEERTREFAYSNIAFLQGDPAEMVFQQPFDAVVGRFVLMYYPSPRDALRRIAHHVRPGGIVAFQEGDNLGARVFPPVPLFDRVSELVGKALEMSGAEPRMGLKLYSAFIAAGLGPPTMQADVDVIGSRHESFERIIAVIVQSTRSMLPTMLKHGLISQDELDLDAYAQHLIQALRAADGICISPPFIGAWNRIPN